MKLTTIIGAVLVAVALAACSATVTPTVRPTPSATVAPTATPTPTPTPAPTPTPKPQGTYVTTTCSSGSSASSIQPIITFHNVKIGDWLLFGWSDGPQYQFTSNPYTFQDGYEPGVWPWKVWKPGDPSNVWIAHGTLTIPACPG
jgi:hypothetical protein